MVFEEAVSGIRAECKGHFSVFISSLLFYCPQEKFVLCNYMPQQPSLNPEMRAILIDWLVEVQVSFPRSLLSVCELVLIRFQVCKVGR